jgi:hypothetical protein
MLLPAEYVKRNGKLCHLTDLGNKNEDPRGRKATSKCGFWLQVAGYHPSLHCQVADDYK